VAVIVSKTTGEGAGEGACPLPRKKYNSNYNNILYNYNNILFLALATVTPAASA